MKEESSAVFKAAYSRSATVWGIALAVVLDIPLFVLLLLGLQGPTFFVVFLGALFAVFPALIIYFTLAGRTLSYEVGKDEFRVNFRPMKLRTAYALIERKRQLLLERVKNGKKWIAGDVAIEGWEQIPAAPPLPDLRTPVPFVLKIS